MARRCKHPTPILLTRARLSRHDAPRRRRRKLGELRTVHLLAEDGRAGGIPAHQMEPVLPEINADNRWLGHVPLLLNGRTPFSKRRGRPFHYAALLPRAENDPGATRRTTVLG